MQDDLAFIGIDVSKAQLAVAGMPAKPGVLSIANTRSEILRWLDQVPPGARIAMESSGQYHVELARVCHQKGMHVYVLNAHDVYFYAKGLGVRGKSDPSDAEVISRYLREHHLHLHRWEPPSEAEAHVQELLVRRAQVVRHQSALRQSLASLKQAICPQVGVLDRAFDEVLQAIDTEVARRIAEDAALASAQRYLKTITGVGSQISAQLAVLFNRIGFANIDAVVAYSGLDPRPSDSGQKRGRRRLTKRGPALLRRQLWLAAFSASHSKVFKPLYQALRHKGFSATEAMVIMARKLLRIAWAVWRTRQPFDPAKLNLPA